MPIVALFLNSSTLCLPAKRSHGREANLHKNDEAAKVREALAKSDEIANDLLILLSNAEDSLGVQEIRKNRPLSTLQNDAAHLHVLYRLLNPRNEGKDFCVAGRRTRGADDRPWMTARHQRGALPQLYPFNST